MSYSHVGFFRERRPEQYIFHPPEIAMEILFPSGVPIFLWANFFIVILSILKFGVFQNLDRV